jgi:DNA polymerase III delta prime subunit
MYIIPKILKNKAKISLSEIKNNLFRELHVIQTDFNVLTIGESQDKSIGIEEVRDSLKKLFLKNENIYIFIIENANNLTLESQNYLLKFLEEPIKNLAIFLIDNSDMNEVNLIETIKSRCSIEFISNDKFVFGKDTSSLKNVDLSYILNLNLEEILDIQSNFLSQDKVNFINQNPRYFPAIIESKNTDLLTSFFIIDLILMTKYN